MADGRLLQAKILACVGENGIVRQEAVAHLFQCRRKTSPGLDTVLLTRRPTSSASAMPRDDADSFTVSDWFSGTNIQKWMLAAEGAPESIPRLLLAMLSLPSGYELPWIVCARSIATFQECDVSVLTAALREIVTFLNHVVLGWIDESRSSRGDPSAVRLVLPGKNDCNEVLSDTCPRKFWLDILRQAMKLARHRPEHANSVMTGLAVPMVRFSQQLDCTGLLPASLDAIFAAASLLANGTSLEASVIAAGELHDHLRPCDRQVLRDALGQRLVTCGVSANGLGKLATGVSLISVSAKAAFEDLEPWLKLMDRILALSMAAGDGPADVQHDLCELVEEAFLESWTWCKLHIDLIHVIKDCIVQLECRTQLLLLCHRARGIATTSNDVAVLIRHAWGSSSTAGHDCFDDLIWNALLACPDFSIVAEAIDFFVLPVRTATDIVSFLREMKALHYIGHGVFEHRSAIRASAYTKAGTSVYQSVFRGVGESKVVAQRGRSWMAMGLSALSHPTKDSRFSTSQTAMFATIAMVVSGHVSGAARAHLVERALNTLSRMRNQCPADLELLALLTALFHLVDKLVERELFCFAALLSSGNLPWRVVLILTTVLAKNARSRDFLCESGCTLFRRNDGQMDEWWSLAVNESSSDELSGHLLKGLCTMLSICNNESWAAGACRAWTVLSNALVLDRPMLPATVRAEFFSLVEEFVDGGMVVNELCAHLKRSIALRLDRTMQQVKFAHTHQNAGQNSEKEHGDNWAMSNDTPFSFGLFLSLLICEARRTVNVPENFRYDVLRERMAGCSTTGIDGQHPSAPIDCVSLVLSVIARDCARCQENSVEQHLDPEEASDHIKSAEMSLLMNFTTPVPEWLGQTDHATSVRRAPVYDRLRRDQDSARLLLTVICAEFLTGQRWKLIGRGSPDGSAPSVGASRTLSIINGLSSYRCGEGEARERLLPKLAGVGGLSPSCLVSLLEGICDACERHVNAIKEDLKIDEAEFSKVLNAVHFACRSATNWGGEMFANEVGAQIFPLLGRLHDLTWSDITNNACGRWARNERKSSRSLGSRADLREIRQLALECLVQAASPAMTRVVEVESGGLMALKMIRECAHYIIQGLEGDNGDLTEGMLSSYATLAETLAQGLMSSAELHFGMPEAIAISRHALSRFYQILCQFALRAAMTFKPMARLAFATLPRLILWAWRVEYVSAIPEEHAALTELGLPARALEQILPVLRRFNENRGEAWNAIAGTAHTSSTFGRAWLSRLASDEDSLSDSDSEQRVEAGDDEREDTEKQETRYLQLPSPKTLEWALSALVDGLESSWIDVLQVVAPSKQRENVKKDWELGTQSACSYYSFCSNVFMKQMEQMAALTQAVLASFDESETSIRGRSTTLPSDAIRGVAKTNKVCLIVLNKALNTARSFLCNDHVEMCRVSVMEALAFIAAYLSYSTKQCDITDATLWPFDSCNADASNVVAREWATAIIPLRHCESSLRGYIDALKDNAPVSSLRGKKIRMTRKLKLPENANGKNHQEASTMLAVSQALAKTWKELHLRRDAAAHHLTVAEQKQERRRKRKADRDLGEHMRKERRRRQHRRSRNQVVDEWLRKDREESDDSDDDGYDDLEDFLVDG